MYTNATEAPNQDLTFIKEIHKFENTEEQISKAVIKKMCGHLWYLSSEAVALSLFDDNVSVEDKTKIANIMLSSTSTVNKVIGCKRLNANPSNIMATVVSKTLSDFVTPNTVNFFKRFNIPIIFSQKIRICGRKMRDIKEERI